MRVLFGLHYPGYLRYFDTVIRSLAERGHSVEVAFEVEHKQRAGLAALDGAPPGITVGARLPTRRDPWSPLLADLRRGTDYVRYLHPRFAEAEQLRRRMESTLEGPLRLLTRLPVQPAARVDRWQCSLAAAEHLVPASTAMMADLARRRPDVVVLSPLVTDASRQADVVKAARALSIPSLLCVGSWDHLTTKGMIREPPDRVVVWNEHQREEAVTMHGYPRERVDVTGAQPWDRWFHRAPSRDRGTFLQLVGLPRDQPYVLFVGSTASISQPDAEVRFVREWVGALRGSADPVTARLSVLVRPHPYNCEAWGSADLSDLRSVVVWPRGGANPAAEADRADYFDSIAHSAAVVGINTSAMIESACAGRPVLTLQTDHFRATQNGTLHFRYMLPENGGFVRSAATLAEHVEQLGEVLAEPNASRARSDRFLREFVRPHGIDRPATPELVRLIEAAPESIAVLAPRTSGPRERAGRAALFGALTVLSYGRPARMRRAARTVSQRSRRRLARS